VIVPDKTPWKDRLAGADREDQSLEWDAERWSTCPVGERLGFPTGMGNWALGDIIRRRSPKLHEDGTLFYNAVRYGWYRKADVIRKRIQAYDVSAIIRDVKSYMKRHPVQTLRRKARTPRRGGRQKDNKGG